MKTIKELPPLETLQALLDYNPDTGILTWKVSPSTKFKAGMRAGSVGPRGYVKVTIKCRGYQAHRIAWKLFYGHDPEKIIDHIDHDKSNNKIKNLRLATNSENLANQKLSVSSTSGAKGVSFHKCSSKWEAYIAVNGKRKHLGLYTTIKEAKDAYNSAAKEIFKEFFFEG
jgi:hypothetical protein